MFMKLFLFIVLVMNLSSFLLMGIDKWKAIHHSYRIKESTLLAASLLMGSYGSMIAMLLFRHKIRKLKFLIFVPLCMILHGILFFYLFLVN